MRKYSIIVYILLLIMILVYVLYLNPPIMEGFYFSSDKIDRINKINHSVYGDIYVFDDNDHITAAIGKDKIWEDPLCKVIAEYYVEGTDMLDIGANLGLNSIRAHQIKPITGTVHLFEPQSDVFTMMSYNTRDLPKKLYNLVVSNANSVFTFEQNSGNVGATTMTTKPDGIRVASIQLDDIVFDKPISVVKMDVEGGEYEALEGAKKTFAKYKPTLIIELWPANYNRTAALLNTMGYTQKQALGGDDYLFVPNS
uniref:Methyltransferase FkbM domain-containing protein n=1 Tax=viral metagenome TaxID=1070528 RepID=A0A6C0K2X7_9ZZZZ